LFKVTQRKQVRYIQTVEEMTVELMRRGLEGTKLQVPKTNGAGQASPLFEGEPLGKLVQVLGELEDALVILERRGLNLASFLARSGAGGLPVFRVVLSGKEQWFHTAAEVDDYRRREQERLGCEFVVADMFQAGAPAHGNGNGNGHAEAQGPTFFVQELHEVRGINRGLERLREFGLGGADLVPEPRVAGREPPPRFVLENGDSSRVLGHLRELVAAVRKQGEKGLTITRFKGLGEMDGEELWETTLDPAKRTLLKVHLDDALKADEMFRTLMGEKVEPRREFIQKHALEVREIDYHGA
jgi:DNA gyrase subunit B